MNISSDKEQKVWAVYDAGQLHAVELTEAKARARRNLMPHADKVKVEAILLSSATLPTAITALLDAYAEERRLRKAIKDEMTEEGARGNLWQNDKCRAWPAYEKIVADIPALIDVAVSQYVKEKT